MLGVLIVTEILLLLALLVDRAKEYGHKHTYIYID